MGNPHRKIRRSFYPPLRSPSFVKRRRIVCMVSNRNVYSLVRSLSAVLVLFITTAGTGNKTDADSDHSLFDPPPESPQAAAPRRDEGSRRDFKDRITPHWFQNNTRFWYRNDPRGGAKEFILVDAERGTRGRAFDHETVAKRIGEGVEPTRLPINELRCSDDGQKVTLVGPDKSWELNEVTGELREAPAEKPAAAGLPAETRSRPSQRTGPETQIEFDNRLSQPVEIFWIDPEGF